MFKIVIALVALSLLSFNNAKNNSSQKEPDIKSRIKETQLASKKDPVCGMPAYKFLNDTTMYQKKIYGFCGKSCKNEFLKTPKKFIHE